MRKTFAIILTALLVLTAFISCNQESIIDDDFTRLVTFDANGGKGTMEPQKITTRTVTALAENKFTLVDHHFTGWNTKADGSGISYGDGGDISITDDITLYAMWSHDKAFILFDKNGGEGEMRTQIVLTNTATALNTNEFTREGFGFTGWNTKADGSGTGYKNQAEISIAEDTTLYAQWTDKSVTVTFYPNGGKETQYTQSVFIGVPTALEKARFTKVDNQFANWDTTASGSGHAYGDEAVVTLTEDLNLYAQWTHDTAKVTFNANGGTGTMADQVVDTNTPTKLNKETFTLADYHFTNWDTTAEGTGHAYGDEANISISADTTLYAQWSHDTAKVTFNANGGTGTMADQVMDTKTETALNANTFTLTDMKFNCWNTKADGTGTSYEDKGNITITADTTLYAQWIHATATIKFNANNEKATGTMADQVVQTKEETALNENAFALTDHHFVEWNTKADGSGTGYEDKGNITLTEDETLYAIWEHDVVTVTFKPNGAKGDIYTQVVETNTPTALLDNVFIKYGYDFRNWNTRKDDSGTTYEANEEVSISVDMTLYAIWEKAPYITITTDLEEFVGGLVYQTDPKNPVLTLTQRPTIDSEEPVTILVYEGTSLEAPYGIEVLEGQHLIILGEGELTATGTSSAAALGSSAEKTAGTITIAGGTVTATGGQYAAGIGGGAGGDCGTVNILDGIVCAYSGGEGASAIGGGSKCEDDGVLMISDNMGLYGGISDTDYWFIGAPTDCYEGKRYAYMMVMPTNYVTVSFHANGGSGIMDDQLMPIAINAPLSPNKFKHDTLFFDGWALTPTGEVYYADDEVIAIEEDLDLYAVWIGSRELTPETTRLTGGMKYTLTESMQYSDRLVLINPEKGETIISVPENVVLTLYKGINVESSEEHGTDSLVLEGNGSIMAYADANHAAIGSDSAIAVGDITIKGLTVTATGGDNAAGIGGGYAKDATITISGGASIVSIGGANAAGIGGSIGSDGADLIVEGGSIVIASGGTNAKAIGAGYSTLTLDDGTIQIADGQLLYGTDTDVYEKLAEGPATYGGQRYDVMIVTIPAKVTFDANGGTGTMPDQVVPVGISMPLDEVKYTHDTLFFLEWNTKKDGSGYSYGDEDLINADKDVTLYAQWIEAVPVTADTKVFRGGSTYTIDSDLTNANRITIKGTDPVTIEIPEGKKLTLTTGIEVSEGKTLIIDGTGTLEATGGDGNAAIGGSQGVDAGAIVINGGTVIATGGVDGAGIGGGYEATAGSVTITGGTVIANGGPCSAGIGGGFEADGAAVSITGGTVKATGGDGCPYGIGGGAESSSAGTLEIGPAVGLYGGDDEASAQFLSIPTTEYKGEILPYMEVKPTTYATVTFNANGGEGTMANQLVPVKIAQNLYKNAFTKTDSFFAAWTTEAAGTGDYYYDEGAITLEEDIDLYAQWLEEAAIDPSYGGETGKKLTGGQEYTIFDDLTLSGRLAIDSTEGAVTLILPEGKTLTLSSGLQVLAGQSVIINGEGSLIATAADNTGNAGIGGSEEKGKENCGNITINGGTVTATGNYFTNSGFRYGGAGIGGARSKEASGIGGTVTINGGNVTATGASGGAGIGGGSGAVGGTVVISGEDTVVNATGGADGGAGIGGGSGGAGADVTINGGTVYATGKAGGIGKGSYGSSSGTLAIGAGLGLYGGATAEAAQFLSAPTDSYTGNRPVYMEAKATTYVTVKYDANNTEAEGEMADQLVPSGIECKLDANAFTLKDHILAEWNTKADGTGTSFANKEAVQITEGMTLYAQWAIPLDDSFETNPLKGGEAYILTGNLTLINRLVIDGTDPVKIMIPGGKKLTLTTGIEVSEGKTLIIDGEGSLIATGTTGAAGIGGGSGKNGGTVTINGGTVNATGGSGAVGIGGGAGSTSNGTLAIGEGMGLYGGADKNHTLFLSAPTDSYTGDRTAYMEAKATTGFVTITFDANISEPSGTMDPQLVPPGVSAVLSANAYSKTDLYFMEWNTKADGTGTSYADKGTIKTDADITLYAQWTDAIPIDSSLTKFEGGKKYSLYDSSLTLTGRITIDGTEPVTLDLVKNTALTLSSGLSVVAGQTLIIEGEGSLVATGAEGDAGIGGGFLGAGGNVTINGGTVTATGGSQAAGIGGGYGGEGGEITITGGTVNATGGMGGAGIGSGLGDIDHPHAINGGTITISGGEVTATSHIPTEVSNAAGIGGGCFADGGTVTISGGTVTATGNYAGAGIGGGALGNGGTVTISGGTVIATGGDEAVGIGKGNDGSSNGTLELDGVAMLVSNNNTTWVAYDGTTRTRYMKTTDAVAITFKPNGAKETEDVIQYAPSGYDVKLAKNTFTHETLFFAGWATSAEGDVVYADQASVNLTEATTLYAKWIDVITLDDTYGGPKGKKLTGGLRYTISDDLTLSGRLAIDGTSEVTLILPEGKTLTLSSGFEVVSGESLVIEGEGTLNATGSSMAAGIGGSASSDERDCGTVTINGGIVTATGGIGGAGIGGGAGEGAGGTVTINGGTVTATGGSPESHYRGPGAGIGGGYEGAGGTVAINGGTVTATGGSANETFDSGTGIGAGSKSSSHGTLELDGVAMLVSNNNTTWVAYDGTTRTRYMKTTEAVAITFKPNGAEETEDVIQYAPSGYDVKLAKNTFTHETLFFAGWATSAEGDVVYADQASVNLTEATTLYAKWIDVITLDDTYGGPKGKKLTGGLRYTISDDLALSGRLYIDGTNEVTLILPEGKTLTLSSGLEVVSGQSLVIEGEGSLNATGGTGSAGIGGDVCGAGGTVTINGGTVTAQGGDAAAGIGGGDSGNGGTVTINGGTVTATGGASAAGIGGGSMGAGGTVTINDGSVFATGGSDAVGIGAGDGISNPGTLTIADGVIMMVSTNNKDWSEYDGTTRTKYMKTTETITITFKPNGATETEDVIQYAPSGYDVKLDKNTFTHSTMAFAGWALSPEGDIVYADQAPVNLTEATTLYAKWAIDLVTLADKTSWKSGNVYTLSEDLTISDRVSVSGSVTLVLAAGKTLTAERGIDVHNDRTLTINGNGKLIAGSSLGNNDDNLSGIGCSYSYYTGGTVIINGGDITAQAGYFASGISGSSVVINGESTSITATGGNQGAGIGGHGSAVIINEGTINATGGNYGPGIGGNNSLITINGGTIVANGGKYGGAGIGTMADASAGATIEINGGFVTATGGYGSSSAGAGIGGGNSASEIGPITITGGTVIATGGKSDKGAIAAGIGGGANQTQEGTVTIGSGVHVYKTGETTAYANGPLDNVATRYQNMTVNTSH